MNRVHTLDGLRGVAIAFVLAGHAIANYQPMEADTRRWLEAFFDAGFGVRLFFVLSGYLITGLLLKEKAVSGSIDLRSFYSRRAFRILPAFYVFLLILALWHVLSAQTLPWSYWIASASFTWNYAIPVISQPTADAWTLGHTWSLAVEAQFYLIWPFVFARIQSHTALISAFVLMLAMPLLRIGTYLLFPELRGYLGMMLHTGADGLLAGCCAAILVRRKAVLAMLTHHKTIMSIMVLLWMIILKPAGTLVVPGFHIIAGFTGDAVTCAWLVMFFHQSPPVWISRWFGSGLLPTVGVISYSVYLWQQIFLSPSGQLSQGGWGVPILLTFLAATCSYLLIEKPFLRMIRHLKPVARPHAQS